jgi:predicted RNase H-like HicB family nuclease
MSEYLVVIEGSGNSYSAFAPDLPGCVAAGDSPEEVER